MGQSCAAELPGLEQQKKTAQTTDAIYDWKVLRFGLRLVGLCGACTEELDSWGSSQCLESALAGV